MTALDEGLPRAGDGDLPLNLMDDVHFGLRDVEVVFQDVVRQLEEEDGPVEALLDVDDVVFDKP